LSYIYQPIGDRKVKGDRELKIIATSGLIKEEATPAEVNAFLSKPYTLKKLLSTLQTVIKQKTIQIKD
jgi:CheY-like chemotaxis protein